MGRSRTYKPRNVRKGDPLTARELQVLALVAAGEPTAAIAKRLGIVEHTIKSHLTSVYKKTGSANRVQAVRHYLSRYTSDEAESSPRPVAAVPGDVGGESLIAGQIREMQARLEQLAPAAAEVQRLERAIAALQQIEPT